MLLRTFFVIFLAPFLILCRDIHGSSSSQQPSAEFGSTGGIVLHNACASAEFGSTGGIVLHNACIIITGGGSIIGGRMTGGHISVTPADKTKMSYMIGNGVTVAGNVQGISHRQTPVYSIRKIRNISETLHAQNDTQDALRIGAIKREAQAFFDFAEQCQEHLHDFLRRQKDKAVFQARVDKEVDLSQRNMEVAIYVYEQVDRISKEAEALDGFLRGLLKKRLEFTHAFHKEADALSKEQIEGLPSQQQQGIDGIQFLSRMIKTVFVLIPVEQLSQATKKVLRASPSLWEFLRGLIQDESDLKMIGEDARCYADHIHTKDYANRAKTHPGEVCVLPVMDWLEAREAREKHDGFEAKSAAANSPPIASSISSAPNLSAVSNPVAAATSSDGNSTSLAHVIRSFSQLEGYTSPLPLQNPPDALAKALDGRPLEPLHLPHDGLDALAKALDGRPLEPLRLPNDGEEKGKKRDAILPPPHLLGVDVLKIPLDRPRLKLFPGKLMDRRRATERDEKQRERDNPDFMAPRGVRLFHGMHADNTPLRNLSDLGPHITTWETIWNPVMAGKGFTFKNFVALWEHIHGKKTTNRQNTVYKSKGGSHRALRNAQGKVIGGTFAHNDNQTYTAKTVRYLQDALVKSGYGPRPSIK